MHGHGRIKGEGRGPPFSLGFILKTIMTNRLSSGILCNQACVVGKGQGCAIAEIFSPPSF